PPRTRASRPRPALAPSLDAGRRPRRAGRARARGPRTASDRDALLLADGAPALRRLPVSLLPPGAHAAPAARGAGRGRGARPAHTRRDLSRGAVRGSDPPPRRGAPPRDARQP